MVYWGYIKKYKCQRQSMETVGLYREQKTSDNFTEYKRLRNMTDALIKKAKKDLVKIKIKENKSCPKNYGKH